MNAEKTDPNLLSVTIIEKCRECSERIENVIEYYAGEFEIAFCPKDLINLCDSCSEPYEAAPTRTPEFSPSLEVLGVK